MRLGIVATASDSRDAFSFTDKDTLPIRRFDPSEGTRIVPGGTTVRDGAYVAPGVIFMPPSYANIGAYIDSGTMIDSHALVGSCAQVGKDCHISAGAQIGGVLEPVGDRPCIVEDNVVMGINSSIAEGVILGEGAVLAPGVNITASTPVYDLVHQEIYRSTPEEPLKIPNGALVVMGSRQVSGSGFARQNRLMIATPIIPKYRDERTDLKLQLEEALR
jgi:2,3,4,5-tetrahydropyridine-2-carboxylate N-succinyltransferase